MYRILAIIERDLRRFRRSPALMMISIFMPLVQLVVLGYAFGGKIKHLEIGVVDHDHGVPAVRLQEMFQAVSANAQTFHATMYNDQTKAMHDLREGKVDAVVQIPPEFSRKVLAGENPRFALIEDNTDQFSASALEGTFNAMIPAYTRMIAPPGGPAAPLPGAPGMAANVSLAVVEVYPYVPYIQFLLPGTIVLAIFVSAMIGGGIIYIDDKARGLHEGYLVAPIRKVELIMGFNLAGAIKAIIAGFVLVTIGSIIAGIPDPLNIMRLGRMMVVVIATSLALISMMSLIMVRVSDPLVPRAIFGMLNTILFFPSGAVYPTGAFPGWMRAITVVDPFTYGVHAFKELVLKDASMAAIGTDLAFLFGFAFLSLTFATLLFKRTL
jgi:ABC-2 type transport system permease protein